MTISVKIVLLGVLVSFLGGCRTPNKTMNYSLSLKDSLYWERKIADTIFHLKGSYLPLVILPKDIQEGDTLKEKKDQANLEIVKKGDTLFIEASCDSMDMQIKFLEERLSRVSSSNESLQEQIKEAPKRMTWFGYGFGTALLLFSLLSIGLYFRTKK